MATTNPNAHVLKSTWQTLHAAGEPTSTVRVANLSASVTGPRDAWGRPGRPQPICVSVDLSLAGLFSETSSGDVLRADTVHYGLLSKHVLRKLEGTAGASLAGVVSALTESLLGVPAAEGSGDGNGQRASGFLEGTEIRSLKLTAHLLKAAKLGSGVSIVDTTALAGGRNVVSWARKLVFHDFRVPVLIGVNENERGARQTVIATVEVDQWTQSEDVYDQYEAVITGVMSNSSFETLEALASRVCYELNEYIVASGVLDPLRYKISLEKPIAVPQADAPCVEFTVDQMDLRNLFTS